MARRQTEDDMDIMQPGERRRVPMMLRDSASFRDPASPTHVFAGDGLEDSMHRPGFRTFANDAARKAKQTARDEYERDLTNAWRDDSGVNGLGSHGPRG